MICVIAGDYMEAERWAHSQQLAKQEWFYPISEEDLKSRENFHVIVVGTAGFNMPVDWFNRMFGLAQQRGRMNRR